MNKEFNLENDFISVNRLKIGDAIRECRERSGYSQNQLSEMMKVTPSTISKIESGKFNFNIDFLSKFSRVLNFEIQLIQTKMKNR